MTKITSAEGILKNIKCIGCDLQAGKIKRVGEKVGETKNFDVQQDYEIPIPGFMILATKKHLKGIENFSKSEREEYIEFLFNIRKAMTNALKVKYVYFVQEEDSITKSSHFHVWIFPRYKWMDKFGQGIKSVRPIMEYSRNEMKDRKNIKKIKDDCIKIKKELYKLQNKK
ncbi:MAG TPA: hypothetical protein VEC16_04960 [Alphaproteobacteria bacterium]|nr:hypothetical protein [Alphaproteobacteria bacterium]